MQTLDDIDTNELNDRQLQEHLLDHLTLQSELILDLEMEVSRLNSDIRYSLYLISFLSIVFYVFMLWGVING